MVGRTAVASMYRHSANGDFRANVTNGGLMEYHQPNNREVDIAAKCMDALGLDFAGIDILFGEDGPVVCEVNSNAHMKNILMCTGINVADHIIRYVVSVINNE
jgi:glutathione synthase/RimK-type ligase-like ATP-grasp enzyme